MTLSVPCSITELSDGRSASTSSGLLANARFTRARSCCGKLKRTDIGLSCVIVTIAELMSDARTILPSSTSRMPVRPEIGAAMVV